MNPLDVFRKRRSVRRFEEKPLPEAALCSIVEAASLAPTARNIQPCRFIVVLEPARLKELARLVSPNGAFMEKAAACLVIISEDTKYYLEDGCAATTQACLCASMLGIGACWIAGDKKEYAESVKRFLNVPEAWRLVSLVAMGYPAETPHPPKKEVKDVFHKEKFS